MPVTKGTIYRFLLVIMVLLPAGLMQSVFPVIDDIHWESLNDKIYKILMGFQRPVPVPPDGYPSSGTKQRPKVAIVTVGSKSRQILGSPVHRRHFIELFGVLKESGNPWILSDLSFPKMYSDVDNNRRMSRAERRRIKELKMMDQLWVDSLRYYKRYIGSSIFKVKDGIGETPGNVLDYLGAKILFSALPVQPKLSNMPFLNLKITEPLEHVDAMSVVGIQSLQPEHDMVDHCIPIYFSEDNDTFVLSTSLLWAFVYASESRVLSWKGARWPQDGKQPFILKRNHNIAPVHCLNSPSVSTDQYLKERKVEILELSDVLTAGGGDKAKQRKMVKAALGGKVVLLTSDLTQDITQNAVVKQPILPVQLKARFLDELLTFSSLRRYPHQSYLIMSWSPLALAIIILALGLFFALGHVLIAHGLIFIGLIFFSLFQLQNLQVFLIPSQALCFLLLSLIGHLVVFFGLKYYTKKRTLAFIHQLRQKLSNCLSLDDLKVNTQSVCGAEFSVFKIFFLGADDHLHEAATSWEHAKSYINKAVREHSDLERALSYSGGEFDQKRTMFQTVLTSMKKAPSRNYRNIGEKVLSAKIAISNEELRLGTLDVQLSYFPYEEQLMIEIINALQTEVSYCWGRLEIQARQRLREFHSISEKIAGNLLGKFLSPAITNRFEFGTSIDANIRKHLKPRPAQVTMIQADIRGFTTIHGDHPADKIVSMLQQYYLNVVEDARKVAQVRLLGDSIFIFIEDKASPREGVSSADLALHLAASFVREAEKQNQSGPEAMPVNFGIAIHSGEVISGNLYGEAGVDYTVIGQNVNLVAKTEELTRIPKVHDRIGTNAIILTQEARSGLRFFATTEFSELSLDELELKVRSFSSIRKLYYLDKLASVSIANRATITRMVNPDLPLE